MMPIAGTGTLCVIAAILAASNITAARGADSGSPEDAPPAMVADPCPADLELPTHVRALLIELFIEPRRLGSEDFERLRTDAQMSELIKASRTRAARDWAGLCRYRNADSHLSNEPVRAVLMGDSITENWSLADPKLFEHGVANRGISGQTSPQMLLRFRQDVLALRPRMVHILAGTNDIAGNSGPTRPEDFEDNLRSMVELAQAHGIEVILGTIPPSARFDWRPGLDPRPWIAELNTWLRGYAHERHCQLIDYHGALADPAGAFKSGLSNDGVHPNREGYRVMRALLEPTIEREPRVTPRS